MLANFKAGLLGTAGLLSFLTGAAADGNTTYPQYLSSGRGNSPGVPWGADTVNNTNPYTSGPKQNYIRSYDFTVSRGTISPDGTARDVLLVNGQFPGPAIEANWGDMIQVTVHNNISSPEEGTTMHWHGILQTTTPYEDGTPGIAQCPIAPGSSYTYSFQADLYGSSFYHSHYSAQYTGGLYGPLLVYGPWSSDYDIDLGPVMLADWGHDSYETMVQQAVDPGEGLVFTQTSLINGKTNANFAFQTGKRHRLRIINAAAESPYTFSIDQHNFSVIAHDFVPVTPYTATSFTLGAGQRADIIVEGSGEANETYYMRSAPNDCSLLQNKAAALAVIYYQQASASQAPTSTAQDYSTGCTFNEISDFGVPSYPLSPPSSPSTTIVANITNWTNSTGNPVWTINRVVFHADYDEPPLLLAHANSLQYPYAQNWQLYNMGSNDSVRIEVYNYNTLSSHPMHLHGHNFYIVAEGYGIWDGTVQSSSNPPRRDTFMLNPAQDSNTPGYTVIEYYQDNPGVWPFHCHIAWHVSAGLAIQLLEQPSFIESMTIPQKANDSCTAWETWQQTHVTDEIDSGLR